MKDVLYRVFLAIMIPALIFMIVLVFKGLSEI
jgi:hypothetical protein